MAVRLGTYLSVYDQSSEGRIRLEVVEGHTAELEGLGMPVTPGAQAGTHFGDRRLQAANHSRLTTVALRNKSSGARWIGKTRAGLSLPARDPHNFSRYILR